MDMDTAITIHNHSLASFLSLTNNNKNEDRWTMGLLMGYYVNMKTGPSLDLAHEFTKKTIHYEISVVCNPSHLLIFNQNIMMILCGK